MDRWTSLRRNRQKRYAGDCWPCREGPETADAIALYALGHAVPVADEYLRRIAERHELVAPSPGRNRKGYEALVELTREAFAAEERGGRAQLSTSSRADCSGGKTHCGKMARCAGCPLEADLRYVRVRPDSSRVRREPDLARPCSTVAWCSPNPAPLAPTCAGVGSCERSHPPPSACTSCTVDIISFTCSEFSVTWSLNSVVCAVTTFYIWINARLIALHFQIEKLLRRLDRILLRKDLLGIDAGCGERIFHLLECGEDSLAIGGQIGVVDGFVLVQLGAIEPAVENDLRSGWSDGPEAAGPVEEVLEARAFEAAAEAESDLGEKGAVADADGGVGRGQGAFGGGDVGPALQQLRGHARGNGRRRVEHGLHGNGEVGGRSCPTSIAIACSYCARARPTLMAEDCAAFSVACASTTEM